MITKEQAIAVAQNAISVLKPGETYIVDPRTGTPGVIDPTTDLFWGVTCDSSGNWDAQLWND